MDQASAIESISKNRWALANPVSAKQLIPLQTQLKSKKDETRNLSKARPLTNPASSTLSFPLNPENKNPPAWLKELMGLLVSVDKNIKQEGPYPMDNLIPALIQLFRNGDPDIAEGSNIGGDEMPLMDIKRTDPIFAALQGKAITGNFTDYKIVDAQERPNFYITRLDGRGAGIISFKNVAFHPALADYHAPSYIVDLEEITGIFNDPFLPAIFPEGVLRSKDGSGRVLYFLDRFIDRHNIVINDFINDSGLVSSKSFAALRSASPEEIREAKVSRLRLHEYFHQHARVGEKIFQYNNFIELKSSGIPAAFEESMVDLDVILEALNKLQHSSYGKRKARILIEAVLSERLLYYPLVVNDAKTSFDATANGLFLNSLIKDGAITINNGLMDLNFKASLRSLIKLRKAMQEHELETRKEYDHLLKSKGEDAARQRVKESYTEFFQKHGIHHKGDFVHHDFFLGKAMDQRRARYIKQLKASCSKKLAKEQIAEAFTNML